MQRLQDANRKNKKHNVFAESHIIFTRWNKHFSQLLNVLKVDDVGQT